MLWYRMECGLTGMFVRVGHVLGRHAKLSEVVLLLILRRRIPVERGIHAFLSIHALIDVLRVYVGRGSCALLYVRRKSIAKVSTGSRGLERGWREGGIGWCSGGREKPVPAGSSQWPGPQLGQLARNSKTHMWELSMFLLIIPSCRCSIRVSRHTCH